MPWANLTSSTPFASSLLANGKLDEAGRAIRAEEGKTQMFVLFTSHNGAEPDVMESSIWI